MNEVDFKEFKCVTMNDTIGKWNMKYIFKLHAQKYKKNLVDKIQYKQQQKQRLILCRKTKKEKEKYILH